MGIQDSIFDVEAALEGRPELRLFDEIVTYLSDQEAEVERLQPYAQVINFVVRSIVEDVQQEVEADGLLHRAVENRYHLRNGRPRLRKAVPLELGWERDVAFEENDPYMHVCGTRVVPAGRPEDVRRMARMLTSWADGQERRLQREAERDRKHEEERRARLADGEPMA